MGDQRRAGRTAAPTRRHVVRGAAWTAPVVLGVAAAPAYAASVASCTGTNCPNLAFGTVGTGTSAFTNGSGRTTAGNAWTFSANGAGYNNTNDIGFVTAGGVTRFAATAEPTTSGRILTATQTGQPALKATCSYTLTFQTNRYIDVGVGDVVLEAVIGASVVQLYTTAGKTGQNVDSGVLSVAVPAGTFGTLSYRLRFLSAGTSSDLSLFNPGITCTF